MSALGDPVRRRISGEDLLRTVINEILEIKNRLTEGKQIPKAAFVPTQETIYLAFSTPIISTTTALTDTYDSGTAKYETSEYL